MGLELEAIRTLELLGGAAPPGIAAEFLARGATSDAPRGRVLWRPGQGPPGIVVPIGAELAEVAAGAAGQEYCHAFYGTGECAGVASAVDGAPPTTELRTIRTGSVFVMERTAFVEFLQAHPAVRSQVDAVLARLRRSSLEERDRIVFLSVGARLARFLLDRACVRRGDGARVLSTEMHTELAARLVCARETLARVLVRFERRGLVRRTPLGLFVTDWAGLSAEAGLGRAGPQAPAGAAEPQAHALRTLRHFLPVLSQRTPAVADEARICGEHLPDLALCVERACPLAVAARRGAAYARPRLLVTPPETADARPAAARRRHRADADRGSFRSPHDEQAIALRVETYRGRRAVIESRFGGPERVPPTVSMFGEG